MHTNKGLGSGSWAVSARHRFRCWSFQLTSNADETVMNGGRANGSVTLRGLQKFLHEHIVSRIENRMPSVVAFGLLVYVHTFFGTPGRCFNNEKFNFHSITWICPDQNRHKQSRQHPAILDTGCFLESSRGGKQLYSVFSVRAEPPDWLTALAVPEGPTAGARDSWWRRQASGAPLTPPAAVMSGAGAGRRACGPTNAPDRGAARMPPPCQQPAGIMTAHRVWCFSSRPLRVTGVNCIHCTSSAWTCAVNTRIYRNLRS
jgi:hypothetical protein